MTPCREWGGHRNRGGYGCRSGRAYKRFGTQLVHRQIMIMMGHDIKGRVVMHLCDNAACFRYDHLAIGTNADNARDMANKGRGRNQWAGVTHCVNGHAFTEENTYLRKTSRAERQCHTCQRERMRRFRDRGST